MRILLAGFLLLAPFTARGGHEIEQIVTFTSDIGASEQSFLWRIQGNEFRLDTLRSGERKHFVFNGRVFYVCGKLAANQIAMIENLNVSNKDFLNSLERGACQELPMDYGVRFLLSPFDAVGIVDVTGGLGTSVEVSEIRTSAIKSSTTTKISDIACSEQTRQFELNDRSEPKFHRQVREVPCIAESIPWRQGIARQMGMALLRSPGGKPSHEAIVGDIAKSTGFALNTTGETSGKDNFGKEFTSKFQVKAKSVTQKKFVAAEIGLPKGFDIIDTRGSTATIAKSTDNKSDAAVATMNEKKGGGLDMLVKILILGGVPAAGIIEALKSDEKSATPEPKK
jgi:hypothetical protein